MNDDDRVPVILDATRGDGVPRPGDLTLAIPPSGPHPVACSCCGGRDALSDALARVFVERARGRRPWFDRVVLRADAPDDVRRVAMVLAGDPLTRARYRDATPCCDAASADECVVPPLASM